MEDENAELVPEPEAEASDSLGPVERIKKLKEKLTFCLKEKQEYLASAKRFKADYLNLRREVEQEKLKIIKFAKEDLLLDLIDLADNFELAMQNKAAWEAVNENWRRGVEYIYSKLTSLFARHNLTEINPLGESFDPANHHSLMSVDTEKKEEENKVLEVVQKGYCLNGKVIRPAQVKVGRFRTQPAI